MDPQRRPELELYPGGEPDHDHAQEKDHEHRRPVAGILRRQVKPADGTDRADGQEPGEQPPLAATRSAAEERCSGNRNRRETAPLAAHNLQSATGGRLLCGTCPRTARSADP